MFVTRRRSLAAPPPLDALARVQAVMEGLRAEFAPLLQTETDRLRELRALAGGDPVAARALLPAMAHDLKGLGATCDRPLVTRAAASLERLLLRDGGWTPAVALHVDALLALARDDATAAGRPCGERLLEALERLAGR